MSNPPLPFGLKFIKFTNIFMISIFNIGLVLTTVMTYMARAKQAGVELKPMEPLFPIMGALALGGVLLYLMILLNKKLSGLSKKAHTVQIVVSVVVGVFSYPVGSVLYIICMYFLLFDRRVKSLFLKGFPLQPAAEGTKET